MQERTMREARCWSCTHAMAWEATRYHHLTITSIFLSHIPRPSNKLFFSYSEQEPVFFLFFFKLFLKKYLNWSVVFGDLMHSTSSLYCNIHIVCSIWNVQPFQISFVLNSIAFLFPSKHAYIVLWVFDTPWNTTQHSEGALSTSNWWACETPGLSV